MEKIMKLKNILLVVKDIEKAKQLASMGYKFSGHTHPGGDYNCLTASSGDYEILKVFNQKKSVAYNSKAQFMTYELEDI